MSGPSSPPTSRPELAGEFGMVASTHWLASSVGMSVLERGGNAFDAAVAAGFVLQVVEPHLNGPGGDLPAVVWPAAEGRVRVVCGQGVAPQAATIEAYRALGVEEVPGTGPLAAVVPGAFGGWLEMLARWGTWSLADVLEPAVSYAERGVPVLPRVAGTIAAVEELFRREWTPSAAVYLPGGAVPQPFSRLRLPGLAATYRRVLADAGAGSREEQIEGARRAWYEGFVAEAVDAHAKKAWVDTSGTPHAGFLTGQDMAGWRASVEEPARAFYGDVEVCKTGLWGQGPVLLQALRLLDGRLPARLEDADASWIHLVLEADRLAFADRDAWYGDSREPDPTLLTDLLSQEYTPSAPGSSPPMPSPSRCDRDRRAGGCPGCRHGSTTSGVAPRPPPPSRGWGSPPSGTGVARSSAGTLCTSTWWTGGATGSRPPPRAAGCSPRPWWRGWGSRSALGRRCSGWSRDSRRHSCRASRPRTTLSPSLALREGKPWMAFGTPGGDQQDQWQLLFFLRVVHGMRTDGAGPGALRLQAAIDAPMLHSAHHVGSFYPRRGRPRVVVAEDRWPPGVLEALANLGHEVERVEPWSLGRLSAVAHDGTWLRAAANARGAQGHAVGR